MNINKFQEEVIRTFSEMDKMPNRKEHTGQSAVIHLVEEVGEIARQITNEYHRPEKFSKENLGEELADLMMFIVLLAKIYNINISEEMQKSIDKVDNKLKEMKSKK
jgi:NTP pyrophosphatase (non-canonical NTP hydrolase)